MQQIFLKRTQNITGKREEQIKVYWKLSFSHNKVPQKHVG